MGWSVFFVPEKHGQLCFCVDYREFNEIILKESYPLHRMEDCIDTLGLTWTFFIARCLIRRLAYAHSGERPTGNSVSHALKNLPILPRAFLPTRRSYIRAFNQPAV